MNTNQLKRFATDARAKLRAGVASKIKSLGFDANGQLMPGVRPPVPMVGGCTWNEQILPSSFATQWEALRSRIERKGLREVVEEAAYTWFNRLMAIRILTMNNITEPVLRFVDEARTPKIVDDARQGRVFDMPMEQRERLATLFKDATRVNEQFALLVAEFCHHTPILQACFGAMDDYTEILLPSNILDKNGFVDMLNSADFISDADYKSPELIGWLYQFYISDRKDEVFAKKGKVEADEIPAATQIFTPNWIVKYMVQNAVLPQVRFNRLPDEDKKYLVSDELPEDPKKPKDLKVADLACGSGHILNECFDILFDLYLVSGYDRRDAIENIFAENLLGIDIDERARQLSTFALMLKACQKDETFADAHSLPQVLSMPDCSEAQAEQFFKDSDISGEALKELREAFKLMKDADSLGSIMRFDISGSTRVVLQQTLKYWQTMTVQPVSVVSALPAVRLILALTDYYDAIVMNPPYMPTSRVDVLKAYAIKNYPDSKADLFSVFMDVCIDRLKDGGKYGMINMQGWMFLNSFELIRKKIVEEQFIESLLHLGAHTFDELSGEVVQNSAFIISKQKQSAPGIYFRLIDGKNCASKQEMFLSNQNRFNVDSQKQFDRLPGTPIAYWLSKKIIDLFSNKGIGDVAWPSKGIITGDNNRFLRLWYEVPVDLVNFNAESYLDTIGNSFKWYPITKGGGFRKWYGNNEYVIDWEDNGLRVIRNAKSENRNCQDYKNDYKFKKSFSWADVCSDLPSFRYTEKSLSESKGMCIFPTDTEIYSLGGFLNSKVAYTLLQVLSPTVMVTAGAISKLPLLKNMQSVIPLVKENIGISKEDWDAHETSWDFQESPLVSSLKDNGWGTLEMSVGDYEMTWANKFKRLHDNEEELNRKFIEIYGLQDELSPDVPLDEVTILQQGEISIVKERTITDDGSHVLLIDGMNPIIVNVPEEKIVWHRDVIIKQLISYIVGCYMGRYRLDKPGLAIAHPNPTDDELADYTFSISQNETFTIDSDAIIPLLPLNAPFYDNLYNYVSEFIKKVWEEKDHNENMNFIERCLGKPLNDYLLKDFWKDHKKMYQNRPIYWLFSSKKGAFKAIVYVHRMHPYTVEQVRSRYLLKYMDWLRGEISKLEQREADLSTQERRSLDRLRSDLAECDEYHERLQVVAEQAIAFDLDDGIPHNHALFGDILTKLK